VAKVRDFFLRSSAERGSQGTQQNENTDADVDSKAAPVGRLYIE
jgi:hypothetical protein